MRRLRPRHAQRTPTKRSVCRKLAHKNHCWQGGPAQGQRQGYACWQCGGNHRRDSIYCPHNQQNLQGQQTGNANGVNAPLPQPVQAQTTALEKEVANLRNELQVVASTRSSPIRSCSLGGGSQETQTLQDASAKKMDILISKMTTLESSMGAVMVAQEEIRTAYEEVAKTAELAKVGNDVTKVTKAVVETKAMMQTLGHELQIVKGKLIHADSEHVKAFEMLKEVKHIGIAIGKHGVTRGKVMRGCEAMLGTIAKAITLSMGGNEYQPFEEGEEEGDEGVHDLTQDEAPRTPAEIAHDEELAAFQENGLGEERVDEEAGDVGGLATQQRYKPTVHPPGVGVDPRARRVRVPTRLAAATPPPPTGAGEKRGADGSGGRPRRRVSTSSA